MSLSSDIARDNTERLPGRKGSANPAARLFPRDLGYCSNNTERSDQYMKPRRETRHHRPALEKQPITESPTMRSFVFNDITIPVAFKAICYGRRVQIWNRQASIITDLTTLALRHGWRCLPISDPCARDAFRSLVASSSVSKEHSDS